MIIFDSLILRLPVHMLYTGGRKIVYCWFSTAVLSQRILKGQPLQEKRYYMLQVACLVPCL